MASNNSLYQELVVQGRQPAQVLDFIDAGGSSAEDFAGYAERQEFEYDSQVAWDAQFDQWAVRVVPKWSH